MILLLLTDAPMTIFEFTDDYSFIQFTNVNKTTKKMKLLKELTNEYDIFNKIYHIKNKYNFTNIFINNKQQKLNKKVLERIKHIRVGTLNNVIYGINKMKNLKSLDVGNSYNNHIARRTIYHIPLLFEQKIDIGIKMVANCIMQDIKNNYGDADSIYNNYYNNFCNLLKFLTGNYDVYPRLLQILNNNELRKIRNDKYFLCDEYFIRIDIYKYLKETKITENESLYVIKSNSEEKSMIENIDVIEQLKIILKIFGHIKKYIIEQKNHHEEFARGFNDGFDENFSGGGSGSLIQLVAMGAQMEYLSRDYF
jgi:hypothetical protein